MSDNNPERPPFRKHPYYYPALKIVVLMSRSPIRRAASARLWGRAA